MDQSPEPSGKVAPDKIIELLTEDEARAAMGGGPIISAQVSDEPMPPDAAEFERPTKFTIPRAVADFAILMADTANRIDPQPASVVALQLQAGIREMKGAIQRRNKREILENSVAIAAFALTLFLLVTPHYQEIEGEEEGTQETGAEANAAEPEVLSDGSQEPEAAGGEQGRLAPSDGNAAGAENLSEEAPGGGER